MVGDNLTRQELVSVGTASVRAADNVPRRVLFIRNSSTGAQIITISLSGAGPAVANVGIPLSPGDSFVDSDTEGYQCYQGVVNAISSIAGGQISVYER